MSFQFNYNSQQRDFAELAKLLRRMSIRLKDAPEPELLSAKIKVGVAVEKAFSGDPGGTDIATLASSMIQEFNRQRDNVPNPLSPGGRQ